MCRPIGYQAFVFASRVEPEARKPELALLQAHPCTLEVQHRDRKR
jgi:hypothetical protein